MAATDKYSMSDKQRQLIRDAMRRMRSKPKDSGKPPVTAVPPSSTSPYSPEEDDQGLFMQTSSPTDTDDDTTSSSASSTSPYSPEEDDQGLFMQTSSPTDTDDDTTSGSASSTSPYSPEEDDQGLFMQTSSPTDTDDDTTSGSASSTSPYSPEEDDQGLFMQTSSPTDTDDDTTSSSASSTSPYSAEEDDQGLFMQTSSPTDTDGDADDDAAGDPPATDDDVRALIADVYHDTPGDPDGDGWTPGETQDVRAGHVARLLAIANDEDADPQARDRARQWLANSGHFIGDYGDTVTRQYGDLNAAFAAASASAKGGDVEQVERHVDRIEDLAIAATLAENDGDSVRAGIESFRTWLESEREYRRELPYVLEAIEWAKTSAESAASIASSLSQPDSDSYVTDGDLPDALNTLNQRLDAVNDLLDKTPLRDHAQLDALNEYLGKLNTAVDELNLQRQAEYEAQLVESEMLAQQEGGPAAEPFARTLERRDAIESLGLEDQVPDLGRNPALLDKQRERYQVFLDAGGPDAVAAIEKSLADSQNAVARGDAEAALLALNTLDGVDAATLLGSHQAERLSDHRANVARWAESEDAWHAHVDKAAAPFGELRGGEGESALSGFANPALFDKFVDKAAAPFGELRGGEGESALSGFANPALFDKFVDKAAAPFGELRGGEGESALSGFANPAFEEHERERERRARRTQGMMLGIPYHDDPPAADPYAESKNPNLDADTLELDYTLDLSRLSEASKGRSGLNVVNVPDAVHGDINDWIGDQFSRIAERIGSLPAIQFVDDSIVEVASFGQAQTATHDRDKLLAEFKRRVRDGGDIIPGELTADDVSAERRARADAGRRFELEYGDLDSFARFVEHETKGADSSLDTAADVLIPGYALATNWGDNSWLGRGVDLGTEGVTVIPGVGLLARGVRGGRPYLTSAAGALEAYLRAPWRSVRHPVETVKSVGQYADTIFNPYTLPLSGIEATRSTMRLPVSAFELGSDATARHLPAADDLPLDDATGLFKAGLLDAGLLSPGGRPSNIIYSDEAAQMAARARDELVGIQMMVPKGTYAQWSTGGLNVAAVQPPFQRVGLSEPWATPVGLFDRAGAFHSTPDVSPWLTPGGASGFVSDEGRNFFAPGFHSRFAGTSAFGRRTPPGGRAGGVIVRAPDVLSDMTSSGKTYSPGGRPEFEVVEFEGTTLQPYHFPEVSQTFRLWGDRNVIRPPADDVAVELEQLRALGMNREADQLARTGSYDLGNLDTIALLDSLDRPWATPRNLVALKLRAAVENLRRLNPQFKAMEIALDGQRVATVGDVPRLADTLRGHADDLARRADDLETRGGDFDQVGQLRRQADSARAASYQLWDEYLEAHRTFDEAAERAAQAQGVAAWMRPLEYQNVAQATPGGLPTVDRVPTVMPPAIDRMDVDTPGGLPTIDRVPTVMPPAIDRMDVDTPGGLPTIDRVPTVMPPAIDRMDIGTPGGLPTIDRVPTGPPPAIDRMDVDTPGGLPTIDRVPTGPPPAIDRMDVDTPGGLPTVDRVPTVLPPAIDRMDVDAPAGLPTIDRVPTVLPPAIDRMDVDTPAGPPTIDRVPTVLPPAIDRMDVDTPAGPPTIDRVPTVLPPAIDRMDVGTPGGPPAVPTLLAKELRARRQQQPRRGQNLTRGPVRRLLGAADLPPDEDYVSDDLHEHTPVYPAAIEHTLAADRVETDLRSGHEEYVRPATAEERTERPIDGWHVSEHDTMPSPDRVVDLEGIIDLAMKRGLVHTRRASASSVGRIRERRL